MGVRRLFDCKPSKGGVGVRRFFIVCEMWKCGVRLCVSRPPEDAQ